jgi:predicted acetyltransferase
MPDIEIRATARDHGTQHELLIDGKYASGLGIVDLVMRIGEATVRMGGIAGVHTDRAHRNKGLARRVLEHSNAWMEANAYDCAILFGIPDFYHKFGYAVCLVESKVEVRTRSAERAPTTLAVRAFTPDDLPAVQGIYAANNADLTGSVVRSDKTHWFSKGSTYEADVEAFVFTDSANQVVAYASRDKSNEEVVIGEVGARCPEYYADIVRWAADHAIELRVETIRFYLPPDSLCVAYLSQYGVRQTLIFPRNGEGMGRIIHLQRFMEKTLPEWTRRADAAHTVTPGAALRLETDIGSVTLRRTENALVLAEDAKPTGRVRLPQWRLMQLAMGYYSADLASAFPEVQAEGDLSLFHALFPRRLPYIWRTDHF